MIPFNLNKALNGYETITRDGRNVRIIETDADNIRPIVALVKSTSNSITRYSPETAYMFFIDGNYDALEEHPLDLFLKDSEEYNINL